MRALRAFLAECRRDTPCFAAGCTEPYSQISQTTPSESALSHFPLRCGGAGGPRTGFRFVWRTSAATRHRQMVAAKGIKTHNAIYRPCYGWRSPPPVLKLYSAFCDVSHMTLLHYNVILVTFRRHGIPLSTCSDYSFHK
ncbi:hypothetical protein KCP70_01005 [Salmonella enterica subsp. enterica]|nr:hypothetical protein KCP70_01005 [Salmonella enterica subsp. enterica]